MKDGFLCECVRELSLNRLLQRCGLVHSTKWMDQESQRQTASKLALETAQNRTELEAQRETLAKLTHQVSSLEHQLNKVVGDHIPLSRCNLLWSHR